MVSHQDNVSVIGLGNMGSALARAISATDHHLTVWNRSEAKSHAMREEGDLAAIFEVLKKR